MSGWNCRPCARNEHNHCWEETNGVFCVCQHDNQEYVKQVTDRCDSCDYVTTEHDGRKWCINHKCPKFEKHMKLVIA